MNPTLRMLLGCTVPLLLLFMLPALGVSEDATLFVAVILMFACHLIMLGGHGHAGEDHPGQKSSHLNSGRKES